MNETEFKEVYVEAYMDGVKFANDCWKKGLKPYVDNNRGRPKGSKNKVRTRKNYNKNEIHQLKAMRKHGYSYKAIAKELGRTESSTWHKANKLGL